MPTDVRPSEWPQGSGYAHGMMAEGRVLCLAGQIGWDARTQLVVPGGLVPQIRQALANVVTVLEAGGGTPSDIVRLTWFITDRDGYLREQKAIGSAYRDVMGKHFPAMSVIVVAGLLERDALVEIEATAILPTTTS